MQKLIKLNDQHYVIVDDSLIKLGDYFYHPNKALVAQIQRCDKIEIHNYVRHINDFIGHVCKKITHSTQPLEEDISYRSLTKNPVFFYCTIKQLFLSDVEEIIYGYNLLKMTENFSIKGDGSWQCPLSYEMGFKAHQELVKDKLFTIEDIQLAFSKGATYAHMLYPKNVEYENNYKNSLLPKTEWDIEIDEQNKITLI